MPQTATKTFKAYQLTKQGIAEITPVDRPMKKPLAHQVLIKTKAVSLNFRDVMVTRGTWDGVNMPVVPLSDCAGEVVEVGESVTKFKVGDRVSANYMPDWTSGELTPEFTHTAPGFYIDGVHQEYNIFNEQALVHIPSYLDYEEAASLPCAAVTAWNAMFFRNHLKPGDTILTLGTGGVSIFALQFAVKVGAEIISTSSSDAKIARLKEMGATHTINYKSNPTWDEAVMELTKGRGVDLVVDIGGAGTIEKSIKSTRHGGSVAAIGVLAKSPSEFNPFQYINITGINLQGVYVGSRQMYEQMNRALELHQIKPVIDKVFPAAQICQALDYMESGQHFGKIVLKF
jgi:NADPH:quinone reductase-like Zn-dependent oxidoreductase